MLSVLFGGGDGVVVGVDNDVVVVLLCWLS